MTQGITKKKARPQDGTGERADNQARRQDSSQGSHVKLEGPAVAAANRVLYAIMEFGATGPVADVAPEIMPTPALVAAAAVIRDARAAGRNGIAETISYVQDNTADQAEFDSIKATLIDVSEGVPERPVTLAAAVRRVREYHRAKRLQILTWRLQNAQNEGAETCSIIAELATLEVEPPTLAGEPFPFTRAYDLEGTTEPADFVEDLLTSGGASVIYGPSNCGKSFWILDLAACVATGRAFRDELEVDQGAVVYVALEGAFGVNNRIEALKRAGRLSADAPLYLCFAPVSLLTAGHADRLAATVKAAAAQSAFPCRLVILDTLARAMAGGDENSGQDMTQAMQSIDAIRAATEAHVATVHHCGKDEARGARGHSSLRAAVDTEIEVSRADGETVSTVRVTKQRDLPTGEPMPFTLEVVTLGVNRRGRPITSCTVRHEESIMAATRCKAGRKPDVAPARLLELLPQPSTAEWAKAAANELGVSKSAFYRAKDSLGIDQAARMTVSGNWERL